MKIGIFGGAFNPVHNGHINLLSSVLDNLPLEKVLIIPTKISPHKDTVLIDFSHRKKLLSIAFKGIRQAEISDIEQREEGKSYTINTINALKQIYPSDEFYLIIGGDMLLYFKNWYKYREILAQCSVVAAARHSDEYERLIKFSKELKGNIDVINANVVDMSSSLIREKIAENQDVSGFMPAECVDYIKKHKLYS